MKKRILLTGLLIGSAVAATMAQTAYINTFDAADTSFNQSSAVYSRTVASGILAIQMTDSVGPSQCSVKSTTAGDPCADSWYNLVLTLPKKVDMTTNQTISMTVDARLATVNFVINAQPQDAAGKYVDIISMPVTAGSNGVITFTFTGNWTNSYGATAVKGVVDMTSIVKVNFNFIGAKLSAAPWNNKFKGNFGIDNLTVGGALAGINNPAENIASSIIYPNPSSETAMVELNLNTPSNVKVTLTDMMGREAAVVAQGKMSDLKQSIDVSTLAKGLYTVNYFLNGVRAKAELFMVK